MKKIFLALLISLTHQSSFAKIEDCKNVFRVAVNGFWPISFLNKNGEYIGAGHDISQELQERTGCQFRADNYTPFANWKSLEKGKSDLILMNIKDSYAGPVPAEFVELTRVRRVLVVRSNVYNKKWSIQDYINAPKVRLAGVIKVNFAYKSGEIEILRKQHLYVETTTHQNSLDLLRRNLADATFFTQIAFEYYQKKAHSKADLVTIPDNNTWLSVGAYISSKTLSAKDREMIRSALSKIVEDGTLKKTLLKYSDSKTVESALSKD